MTFELLPESPGFEYDLLSSMSGRMISVITRPPQNVDVRAILDFLFPCSRPWTPGFYSRRLLTKHEGYGRKGERGTQRSRPTRTSTSWGDLFTRIKRLGYLPWKLGIVWVFPLGSLHDECQQLESFVLEATWPKQYISVLIWQRLQLDWILEHPKDRKVFDSFQIHPIWHSVAIFEWKHFPLSGILRLWPGSIRPWTGLQMALGEQHFHS